ncbi:hypothetical protein BDN72DRAFT_859695 [Pluteus cervinus]|uniref:Uncharacterized protein n=1 Tax=Pluteus cervinus TaxID=181527 RepID=A0ACD3ALY3_9AGAR|nr:hypothetical protein BDN72DRAFT_859695 [Pluteus cervinus]
MARFQSSGINKDTSPTPDPKPVITSPPTRFQLPGFGLPLNYLPRAAYSQYEWDRDLAKSIEVFYEAIGIGKDLLPTMLNSGHIRSGDAQYVFDEVISKKWKQEALATPGLDVSEKMIDWAIEEARYKFKLPLFVEHGAICVYDGDVVKSDTVIPQSVKEALQRAVAPLEDVPENNRDWHPGSNEQVLDLVHPSLFPLIYGKSRILPDSLTSLEDFAKRCGEGVTLPVPPENEAGLANKRDLGRTVTVKRRGCIAKSSSGFHAMLIYLGSAQKEDYPQQMAGEDENDYWDRRQNCDTREGIRPEPATLSPPSKASWDALPSGELKPENVVDLKRSLGIPSYPGGTWHVKGQLLTRLSAIVLRIGDEQDDHDWLPVLFGCEQHGTPLQNIGGVETKEGRVITFPNILQHQVQPFQLADPTRPGHRKILALFPVDPHIRVISTANVPCQRQDGWSQTIQESAYGGTEKDRTRFNQLPVELMKVVDEVEDFPIRLEEAKRLRDELTEERKAFVVAQQGVLNGFTISLCEH